MYTELDFKKCFEERTKYYMKQNGDPLLDVMLDCSQDSLFIVPNHVLWDESFQLYFETHNVSGIFSLGKIMINVSESFSLIANEEEPVASIKIGAFIGATQEKRYKYLMAHEGELLLPETYTDDFEEYLSSIQKWMINGIKPVDTDTCYYNEIVPNEITPGRYNAFYYSKSAIKTREIISCEITVPLGSVADVIIPQFAEGNGYAKTLSNKRYPFKFSDQYEASKSDTQLHKGDLLIPRKGIGDVYLLDQEPEDTLFATTFDAVIRCRKIIPEYLYLYLKSEVAKSIIDYSEGSFNKPLDVKEVEEIPIIIPRFDNNLYINDFKILTAQKREYGNLELNSQLKEYYNSIHNADYPISETKTIEEILSVELAKKIRTKNKAILKPLILEDVNELNVCFTGGAYKAALILAGSIMEAILIDWLSEIDHKNYFTQDYMVIKNGDWKRGDLIDYINAIKEIKRPEWMTEASHAHEIRKKRNLVHAKLCMKSDVEINENTCKQVISYLKQIIHSRGVL